MYRLFLSVFFLSCLCQAAPLPDFQAPFYLDEKNQAEKQTERVVLVIEVYKASQRNYTDPKGIWEPHYLQKNPEVEIALKEFFQGKRGHSLAQIHPEGKTAQALHVDLINAGFSWKTVPLLVSQGAQKKYWKLNGAQTADEKDPQVVKMHIYIHRDGGMVRVKASGVPDKTARYPRRSPHVVMAVLKDFDPTQCGDDFCNYDTSYDNEAFKVTREGRAGPKAPEYGFKHPFDNNTPYARELNHLAEDIYMDLVHTSLKTNDPNLLYPYN